MPDYARRSARVLLIDAAERLLLIKSLLVAKRPEAGHAWFTPGGGVEPGEDLAAAAARELWEEVGLRVEPAGLRHVAFTAGHADLGWAKGLFRDDFLLHRVTAHEVDDGGNTELERGHHVGYHWWTVAELAATTETVYPLRLAELVAGLVAGRIPGQPVELPFHH